MSMARRVLRNGKLAEEQALFEFCQQVGVMHPVENQCWMCCGTGELLEQIDDDRLPFVTRCWRCKGTGRSDESNHAAAATD
jgi:DnaJ-class molecular chaperone